MMRCDVAYSGRDSGGKRVLAAVASVNMPE